MVFIVLLIIAASSYTCSIRRRPRWERNTLHRRQQNVDKSQFVE